MKRITVFLTLAVLLGGCVVWPWDGRRSGGGGGRDKGGEGHNRGGEGHERGGDNR